MKIGIIFLIAVVVIVVALIMGLLGDQTAWIILGVIFLVGAGFLVSRLAAGKGPS